MGWPRDTESFPEPSWWNGDQPFDTPANDDEPEDEEMTDEEYERAAEDEQRRRDADEGFDE